MFALLISLPGWGQIKLLNNGNVGLGTVTPGFNLEVFGQENPIMGLREPNNGSLEIGIASCNGCYSPFSVAGDAVFRKMTANPTSGGTNNMLFTIIDNQHLGQKYIKFTTEDLELFSAYDNQTSKFTLGQGGIGIGNWYNGNGVIPLLDQEYELGSSSNRWLTGYFYTVNYGSLYQFSDQRLKRNLLNLPQSLEKITKLNGYSFNYKSEKDNESKHYGFIAQEVKMLFPDLVSEGKDGMLSVKTTELIPVLVEAIKEQNIEINKLKSEVASLSLNTTTGYKQGGMALNYNELYDCQPNPFSSTTTVRFKLLNEISTAKLVVVNLLGETLIEHDVKGQNKIEIDGSTLKPGTYLYTLFVDGKEVATKKMLLSK